MQDYAIGKVCYNGSALVEVTNIERVTEGGLIKVTTLEKAFAGHTAGGGGVTLNISYATPIGGQEQPIQEAVANRESVTIQQGFGPKAYMATGKILRDTTSQGVDANAEGSFEWEGPLKAVK